MAMYIPEAHRRPHLFLSHSSKDKSFVKKLANDLNRCEIDVWLDAWEIGPGDSLYDKLSAGIESSKDIALILTQSFLDSKWSSEELKQAFAREKSENIHIILPLLVENVKIPGFILDKIYIPFIDSYYEGLAILASMLHGLSGRAITDSFGTKQPKSVKDVLALLKYCGLNLFEIIPKDVFDEIAKTGFGTVSENRIRFHPRDVINSKVSSRTKDYMKRMLNED